MSPRDRQWLSSHSAATALTGGHAPLFWQRQLAQSVGDLGHLPRVSQWVAAFGAIPLHLATESLFGRSLAVLTGATIQSEPPRKPLESRRIDVPRPAIQGEVTSRMERQLDQLTPDRSRSASLSLVGTGLQGRQTIAPTARRRPLPGFSPMAQQADETMLRRAAGEIGNIESGRVVQRVALPTGFTKTEGLPTERAPDTAMFERWMQELSQRAGRRFQQGAVGWQLLQHHIDDGSAQLASDHLVGLTHAWTRALGGSEGELATEQLALLTTETVAGSATDLAAQRQQPSTGNVDQLHTERAAVDALVRGDQAGSKPLGPTNTSSGQRTDVAAVYPVRGEASHAQASVQSPSWPIGPQMASSELLARLAGQAQVLQAHDKAGKRQTSTPLQERLTGASSAESTTGQHDFHRPGPPGRTSPVRSVELPTQERSVVSSADRFEGEAEVPAPIASPTQAAFLPPLRPPRQNATAPLSIASAAAQPQARQAELMVGQDDLEMLATKIKQILDEEARRHGIAV